MSDELKEAAERMLTGIKGTFHYSTQTDERMRRVITAEISALLANERARIIGIVRARLPDLNAPGAYKLIPKRNMLVKIIEAINAGGGE